MYTYVGFILFPQGLGSTEYTVLVTHRNMRFENCFVCFHQLEHEGPGADGVYREWIQTIPAGPMS